ncbi:MAG: hypothetical protein WC295_08950 [Methanoregula sp.]
MEKDLRKIPNDCIPRIFLAIEKLSMDPFPYDTHTWISLKRFFLKNFSHTKNIFWIFPGTISPQTFPGNFPKNFPVHATITRFAFFFKNAASHLLRGFLHPNPHPMQPTLKNENEKQPFLSFQESSAHSSDHRPAKSLIGALVGARRMPNPAEWGATTATASPPRFSRNGWALSGNFLAESCTKNFQPDFALTTLNL